MIGLTGNIGSGKSAAADYFRRQGARRIEADRIGWQALDRIRGRLRKRFGAGIMKNGRIDRKKLRDAVFRDQDRVRYLNRLTHPWLVKSIRGRIQRIGAGTIVLDAALLFDWPRVMALVDHPILVTSSRKNKERRCLRKGIDRGTFQRILRCQKSERVLSRQAEYVIRNDRSLRDLYRQCHRIYKEIKNDC